MHYSHSLARLVPLILALTAGCADGTAPPAPPTPESTVVRLAGRAPAVGSVCASLTAVEAAVRGERIAGGAPVFLDDRFPVGSLTKSMTATLAAVLVDEGVIAWDSRLLEVLPELQAGARPEYANVTLRDLLTHRAGVPTPTSIDSLPELSGDDATQRIQFARWALARPALQPSSSFGDYSNGGYAVAGAMLERAGGAEYTALIESRVFGPIGISVSWGPPDAARDGDVQGHSREEGRWVPTPPEQVALILPPAANPAGGARLSMPHMGRYLQLHLRALAGTRGLPLSPEGARVLHTTASGPFALGWIRQPLGGRAFDLHDGSDGLSYYAFMALSEAPSRACATVATGLDDTSVTEVFSAMEALMRE